MAHEADPHESDQQELVKHQVRYHDSVPFPDGERRLLYRIDSRWHYPSPEGTRLRIDSRWNYPLSGGTAQILFNQRTKT